MSAISQPAGKPRKKKRNSFFRNLLLGAGTILEIAPPQRCRSLNKRLVSKLPSSVKEEMTAEEQDAVALYGDWVTIGNDMRVSFEIIETEMNDYVK